MAYTVAVFIYGDQMENGFGAHEHPDGGTCALEISNIHSCISEDEALSLGIFYEDHPMVHHVIVMEEQP